MHHREKEGGLCGKISGWSLHLPSLHRPLRKCETEVCLLRPRLPS